MINKLQVLTLLTLLFIVGCEKDDQTQTGSMISVEDTNINPFEMVIIKNNSNVDQEDSYSAKFGEIDVFLTKITDNTLAFMVPDVEDGKYQLKSKLGNIDFNVTQIKLEKSVDETISGYVDDVRANFTPTEISHESIGAEIIDNIVSNASDEEKHAIAIYLEANKDVFNDILHSLEKKSVTAGDLNATVGRFHVSALELVVGAFVVYSASSLGFTVPGAIVAGVGLGMIIDGIIDTRHEGLAMIKMSLVNVKMNLVGSTGGKVIQKSANSALSFVNKEPKDVSATCGVRGVVDSDRGFSDIYFFKTFFEAVDMLNGIVVKINSVIEKINKIPFVDVDTVEALTVPGQSDVEIDLLTEEVFSNCVFSTSNNGVKIAAKLKQEGIINITLTAGESISLKEPLAVDVLIDYQDEFVKDTYYVNTSVSKMESDSSMVVTVY